MKLFVFRLIPLLFFCGCLERVTGEPVPIDERFYKSKEAGEPGKGDNSSDPFASSNAEKVTVTGSVSSETMGSIDLDFRTPDPTVDGNFQGHGKLLLERPGIFSVQVPKNIGSVEIQAFQDLQGDGPSFEDPFAQVLFEVFEEDIVDVDIHRTANDDPTPHHLH